MRNWNNDDETDDEVIEEVFSLPMRNWNRWQTAVSIRENPWVFSLPMRNWNNMGQSFRPDDAPVFSLPMRNWNPHVLDQTSRRTAFLAYLWGIETCSFGSSGSLTSSFLAYLWGIETTSATSSATSATSFLAYLWGIETFLETSAGCRR